MTAMTAVLLISMLAVPARAAARDEAWAAYKAGRFAQAEQLYRKAAEQKDAPAAAMLARMYYDGLGVKRDYVEAAKWARPAADAGDVYALHLYGMLVDYGMAGVAFDREEGHRRYAQALAAITAKPDDAKNLFVRGVMARLGHGVEKSDAAGAALLRRAAELGYAPAQEMLGEMLLRGDGAAKNVEEAAKFLLAAARQGEIFARVEAAGMLIDGQGQARNVEEGFKTYRALAEAGYGEAQAQLGNRYFFGSQIPRDYALAREWLSKGAEQENGNAQNRLAELYRDGLGVPKDPAEALRWLRRADVYGSNNARAAIGGMYLEGAGVAKDYGEALKYLKRAAEHGNADAQVWLAAMYQDGLGVEQDRGAALTLLRTAAATGNKRAQSALGRTYEQGWGVGKDPAEAAKWYRLAAAQREPEGEAGFGRAYLNGWGVERSDADALRWFRKAAEHGSADGEYQVGWMLLNGRGTTKDYAEAMRWFQKAAARGHAEALTAIGRLHENGQGVTQDFVEADKFYLLSAAAGGETAPAYSRKLSARMTREQVAEAQKRAAAASAAPAAAASPAPEAAGSDVDAPPFRLAPRPDDFAFVVGIEKYAKLPAAQFAERDAQAVKKTLLSMGVPERNIVSLVGADATRSRMAAYLEEWLPKNVKAGSTVFFYYSGHGAPDAESHQAYLLPSDGDPAFLKTTAYPLKQVYASLNKLKAKAVVVALDSCFSGAGGRSVLPRGARPLVTKVDADSDAGKLVLFTAAGGDQITGGTDAQGHGTFTYYFLKGLGGAAKDAQGAVTAGGLFEYLKPLVEDEAHRQNREQTPGLAGAKDQALLKF